MEDSNYGQRGITLLGIIVLVVVLIGVFFLGRPIFNKMYQGSYNAACTNNLRKIGEAVQRYLNDFGEIAPPAQWCYGATTRDIVRWNQALSEYLTPRERQTIFSCPAKSSSEIGYAVNYRTFRSNQNPNAPRQNFVTVKQIKNAADTIYALDTGRVTDATKDLDSPQWRDAPGDAPAICRVTKSDEYWKTDPVRPMPRHAGKVNCLMFDGVVKSYTVDEIAMPKEKAATCLWDAY